MDCLLRPVPAMVGPLEGVRDRIPVPKRSEFLRRYDVINPRATEIHPELHLGEGS